MKLIILLSCIMVIHGAALSNEEKKCEGIMIDGVYYDREVLKTDLDQPYSLAVDFSTNVLYFSYSVNTTGFYLQSAKIDLNTKEFADIRGIDNGFVQTVDQENHDVYVGSSKGIYKYDQTADKATPYAAFESDIWDIYFKDVLYYSELPSQFLYTFKDGETARFKDLDETKVNHFAIDKDEDMFYTNATGLYSQKKETKDAILYKNLENGFGVRAITTDVNGVAYVCLDNGVYKANKSTATLEKVVNIDDSTGVAFDRNNNIVYGDATSLIYLKPNKNKTC